MAELQDDEVIGELEAVEQKIEQQAEQKTDIPEKYRGKSVEDIVKMHQDTERNLSRQGQELGEVRRLADELLKSQLLEKASKEKPKEVDFFENPQEAIRQAIESNPKMVAVEQSAVQSRMNQARQELVRMHPDFQDIVQSQGFGEWVKTSRMRTEMFNRAENYDIDAADELLSTFKKLNAVKQEAEVKVDRTAQKKAISDVSVDSGGSGETTKKVYRRADLIRLKMRDPAKYDDMSQDIARAYMEGRVR